MTRMNSRWSKWKREHKENAKEEARKTRPGKINRMSSEVLISELQRLKSSGQSFSKHFQNLVAEYKARTGLTYVACFKD